jgi:3-oxoacyl-[acyl-carrier protein] reductase
MELNLSGRTALITGGSKGIGFAVAQRLAAEGCNLRLAARSAGDLDQAAAALKKGRNIDVATFALDLAQPAARAELAAACPDVDILVNCAGGIPGGSIEEVDDARWRTAWDLKVFGYINMTREYFARMKARKRGVIINIIGVGGEKLDSGYIAGATGNAALLAFTKALGSTSADVGVRVLGVNPGPVETDRFVYLQKLKAKSRLGDETRWREFYQNMPYGRAATPDEIAAMVTFLASDLSSYISGTIVTIDGGITNRGQLP